MSRASDAHDDLAFEWSSFFAVWQETRAAWNDDVARQFEKRFVEEWERDVPSYLSALKTLENELRAVQRELRR